MFCSLFSTYSMMMLPSCTHRVLLKKKTMRATKAAGGPGEKQNHQARQNPPRLL
jgi:hypothetical protein